MMLPEAMRLIGGCPVEFITRHDMLFSRAQHGVSYILHGDILTSML